MKKMFLILLVLFIPKFILAIYNHEKAHYVTFNIGRELNDSGSVMDFELKIIGYQHHPEGYWFLNTHDVINGTLQPGEECKRIILCLEYEPIRVDLVVEGCTTFFKFNGSKSVLEATSSNDDQLHVICENKLFLFGRVTPQHEFELVTDLNCVKDGVGSIDFSVDYLFGDVGDKGGLFFHGIAAKVTCGGQSKIIQSSKIDIPNCSGFLDSELHVSDHNNEGHIVIDENGNAILVDENGNVIVPPEPNPYVEYDGGTSFSYYAVQKVFPDIDIFGKELKFEIGYDTYEGIIYKKTFTGIFFIPAPDFSFEIIPVSCIGEDDAKIELSNFPKFGDKDGMLRIDIVKLSTSPMAPDDECYEGTNLYWRAEERIDITLNDLTEVVVLDKTNITNPSLQLNSGSYVIKARIDLGEGFAQLCTNEKFVEIFDPEHIVIENIVVAEHQAQNGTKKLYHITKEGGTASGTITITGRADKTVYSIVSPAGAILSYLSKDTYKISGLKKGVNSIIVSDEKGCNSTVSKTIDITSVPKLSAVKAGAIVDVKCHGKKTGSVSFNITGGFGPYKVTLSAPGHSNVVKSELKSTSDVFDKLAGGNYTIKVEDNEVNNPSKYVSSDVFTIKEASKKLTFVLDVNQIQCFGDKASFSLKAKGGYGLYDYYYEGKLENENKSSVFTFTKESLTGGTYNCKIVDGLGCSTVDIPIEINDAPAEIVISDLNLNSTTGVDGIDYHILTENGKASGTLTITGRSGDYKILSPSGAKLTHKTDNIYEISDLNAGSQEIKIGHLNCISNIIKPVQINKVTPVSFLVDKIKHTDITCYGKEDGTISFELENGCGPYDINLYSGASLYKSIPNTKLLSGTFSKVANGTYRLKVFDRAVTNIVEFSSTIVINEPSILELIATSINPLCFGDSSGKISLSASGGSGTNVFTINDSPYSTSNTFKAGTYTCLVTDKNGCIDSKPIVLTEPKPILFDLTSEGESCETADNGKIQIKNLTYDAGLTMNYKLNGASNSPDVANEYTKLNFGTYKVTISDENSCSTTKSVDVLNLGQFPTISYTVLDSLACSSASNGAIDVDFSTVDTYGLYDSNNKQVDGELTDDTKFTGLDNQAYKFIATDSENCSSEKEINVPVSSDAVKFESEEWIPATCSTASNGIINVEASGGVPDIFGYTFTFNGVEKKGFTAQFDDLAVGTKGMVTVKDQLDCTANTKEGEIQVTMNLLEITGVDKTDPVCFDTNTGEIKPIVLNGSVASIYTIEQKNVDTFVFLEPSNYVAESKAYENLKAGIYRITVEELDGCSSSYVTELLNPEKAEVTASSYNLIEEKGKDSGEYEITLVGINKSFTYKLNKLVSGDSDIEIESGKLFYDTGFDIVKKFESPLVAGKYRFALTDDNGCLDFDGSDTYTEEFTIQEPEFDLSYTDEVITDVSCNGLSDGAISISGVGGWGEYTYSLNGGLWQTNGNFTNLVAGNYSIEIRDREEISITHLITIIEPDIFSLSIDKTKDATCPAYANGRVVATSENGIPFAEGLHYWIENTNDRSIIFGDSYSGHSYEFKELPKGNYELFVSDSHTCSDSEIVTISEPEPALIEYTNNFIIEKGLASGEISMSITGGNGLFDYQCLLNDELVPFETGQTTGSIQLTNLLAGTYHILARDTAGCVYEDKDWMERTIEIKEPEMALSFVQEEISPVSCNGLSDGFIRVKPIGGWGDYRYQIDSKAPQFNGDFYNLSVGTYTVRVTDSLDISSSQDIIIVEPEVLDAEYFTHEDAKCSNSSDGSIQLKVDGGNAPYELSVNKINWAEGLTAGNLKAGLYTVFVKDSKGCENQVDGIQVNEPEVIALLSSDITKSRCLNNEGKIASTFEGGTGAYSYHWSKDTTVDGNKGRMDLPQYTGSSINDLYSSSRYMVKVTDEHGCYKEFYFAVGDITDLSIENIDVTNVSCYSYSDGIALASVVKGNPPYTYDWGINISDSENESAKNIVAGKHTLFVRDIKGCGVDKEFIVGSPDSLFYQINELRHPLCYGGAKGEISLNAIGGTPDYFYKWIGGSTKNTIRDLNPGKYSLQITDSHNCISSFDFELDYERILEPFIGNDTLICHYNSLLVDGGDYEKYSWSATNGFSSSREEVSIKEPGIYSIEVEDADNCIGYDTVQVDVSYLKIDDLVSTDVTCSSFADGNAQIAVSPADWKHVITWPDGSNASTWNNLSGGNYQVQITDDYGCSDKREFSIYEPEELKIEVENLFHPLCFGVPDGFIRLNPLGGNGDYLFAWEHGSDKSRLTKLDQGDYSVLLTDKKGCQVSENFTLEYQKAIYPDLGEDQNICSNNFISLYPGVFAEYMWMKGNRILDNTESDLVVWDANEYSVEVKDEDGCTASDTINVSVKASELNPVLLAASSVAVGDTLMVMDVSQPQPESLTWEFTGAHIITEQTAFYCLVVFQEEGMYEMRLSALLDNCIGEVRESILVVPASNKINGETETGTEAYVHLKKLIVAPNPSDGNFAAEAELAESAEITFYLVNLQNGQIIEKRKRNGLKTYRENYSVSQSGSYCVYAESKGERKVVKLIVL